MEIDALNREEARNFIKTYHIIYVRDSSDVEIKDHLARETQPGGVDWLKHFDIF